MKWAAGARRSALALRPDAGAPQRSRGAGVLLRDHRLDRRTSGRRAGLARRGPAFLCASVLAAAAGFAVTFATRPSGAGLARRTDAAPRSTCWCSNHIRINVNQRFWYTAVELGRVWIAWALAGLGASIVVSRALLRRDGNVYRILAPFQILFGGAGLLISLFAPTLLLGFVTPFCWLLLCPRAEDRLRGSLTRESCSAPPRCCRLCTPTRLPAARLTSCAFF